MSNSGFLFRLAPAARSGNEGFCSSFKASLSFALRLFLTPSKSKIFPCFIISSILRHIHGRPSCQCDSFVRSATVTTPFVAISALFRTPFIQKALASPFNLLMSCTRANAQLFSFISGSCVHKNATNESPNV